ncbi:MAG TPA: uroporphyrinogen decarboxylase [Candidatus Limnocylindrales bacterium]|nr:uroporphyrinogen decarboxylase [Candidatus Limnocylindrales bacterium]
MEEARLPRFLAACRGLDVDATPVWFMRQAGRSLPEYRAVRERYGLVEIVGRAELCAEVSLQPVRRLGVDAAIVFADLSTPLPGLGLSVEVVDGVGPVVSPLIRSAADLAAFRPFEPRAAVGPLLEAIGLLRRASPVPVIGFAGAPFTVASYLVEGGPSRDLARTRAFLIACPDLFADLLSRLGAMTAAYLRAQVEAGAQALQLFDSWAGALAPVDYALFVRPVMATLLADLADLEVPIIHFATGTAGYLELQAAAGGDVIGLDWRVDLGEARRRLGRRPVQGNLEPQGVLAPWPALAARADAVLAAAGDGPGHVFNLGHGVPAAADPEVLRRLVDHVHERTARRPAGSRAA